MFVTDSENKVARYGPINFNTKPPTPPQLNSPIVRTDSSTQISITLDTTFPRAPCGQYQYYTKIVNAKTDIFIGEEVSSRSVRVFKKMQNNTNYYIIGKLLEVNSRISGPKLIVNYTHSFNPTTVEYKQDIILSTSQISNNSTLLTWDMPHKSSSQKYDYSLSYQSADSDSITILNVTEKTHKLTNLTSCKTYYAIVESGTSYSEQIMFQTLPNPYSGTVSVNFEIVGSNEFTLVLTESNPVRSHCGSYIFRIDLSHQNGTLIKNFITPSRQFLVTQLLPAKTYTVSVSVLETNSKTESASVTKSVQTMDASKFAIASPTSVTAMNIKGDSLKLAWVPPSIPEGLLVVASEVYYSKSDGINKMIENKLSFAQISGLKPCTNYSFSVRVLVNETEIQYKSSFSSPFTVQTLAGSKFVSFDL
ncbi:hypothetical protein Ciccas_013715 [Cichlidogyrus casuarinus]|uniref:Fibronectin type-III domain-containing protein n=1 Tax=Cichlidogyrus casuarinus TaxID=1844966 RepID=A0ABD2PKY5_9PLAT